MAGTSSAGFGYGSLIAQGVSNTIAAFGSFGITNHKNAIAESQARIARLNAQMMMRQYEQTLYANDKAVAQRTLAAGQVKGSQRAALAANGVAVGDGSAAELQASTDLVKEIDVNTMTANATRQAWGYRMQAVNYMNQSYMAEAQKQNKWDVFGATLLGGASQVATNYMAMSAMGMFNSGASSGGGSWTNLAGASKYGLATNASGWGSFAGASKY